MMVNDNVCGETKPCCFRRSDEGYSCRILRTTYPDDFPCPFRKTRMDAPPTQEQIEIVDRMRGITHPKLQIN